MPVLTELVFSAGISPHRQGGQFELGVGRDQIQLLAALFHPDTPNAVAPGGYNGDPVAGLSTSPLSVTPTPTGFRLAA
jgi:hypothetical protein